MAKFRKYSKEFQQTGELASKAEYQPKIDKIRKLRKELAQLKMENEIFFKPPRTLQSSFSKVSQAENNKRQ